MCLSLKHVNFLDQGNETDLRSGKVSFETYYRFKGVIERCPTCPYCDNGQQGDVQPECRDQIARAFSAMKCDAERWINDKWIREADEDAVAVALERHLPRNWPRRASGA